MDNLLKILIKLLDHMMEESRKRMFNRDLLIVI